MLYVSPSMLDIFDSAFQDGADWANSHAPQELAALPDEARELLDLGLSTGAVADRGQYLEAWRAGVLAKWARLTP